MRNKVLESTKALHAAFRHMDKKQSGRVTMDALHHALYRFDIQVSWREYS
jgi:Ca2+-binding EF-hand superfamily protein